MSQEPEKPIESQLWEHAKKRRSAAGDQFGLHPATRRMLQAEVARTYGSSTPVQMEHPKRPWWSYWPRVLFASCCALLLAVLVMRPGDRNLELVRATEVSSPAPVADVEMTPAHPQPSAALPVSSPAPAPSPQTAPMVYEPAPNRAASGAPAPAANPPSTMAPAAHADPEGLVKMQGRKSAPVAPASRPVRAALNDRLLPSSTASTPVQSEGLAKAAREATAPSELADVSKPASPAQTAPEQMSPSLTVSKLVPMKGAFALTTTQAASEPGGRSFTQTLSRAALRRNFQSPPNPQVLEEFQLEKNGAELRFVDRDGSIYIGRMTDEATTRQEFGERSRSKDAAALAVMENVSSHTFRATGFNRTLNQPVTIDGSLLENGVMDNALKAKTESDAKKVSVSNTNLHLLQIQGRVQIGDRQELIINAVPVNR